MKKKLIALLGIMGALSASSLGCSGEKTAPLSANATTQEAPFVDEYDAKDETANYANEADIAKEASNDFESEGNVSDSQAAEQLIGASNETNTSTSLTSNIDLSKHKIIQKAVVSFTTTDYEKSFQTISKEVNEANGYVETADINGIKPEKYGDLGRSALIVIRVPAQKFESVLQNLRGTGVLVSEQRETINISSQYRDTQARLETIDIQISNLQQLLAQTKKLEDMLRLEEEISRLIYEKEGFQSKLQTWDDLVQYATIEINLNEINTIEPTITYGNNDTYERSFGQQMSYAFEDANVGFVYDMQNFLIWAAENWIGILIFVVIIVAVILIVKNINKKRKLKKENRIVSPQQIKESKVDNKTLSDKDADDKPKTPPTV